jgi:hypothetical protein
MREKNRHGKESKWKEEKGKERERKEEEGRERKRKGEKERWRRAIGIYKTGIFLLDYVFEDYAICLQAANVYT